MNGHDPRTTRPLGSGGPTGTQMMPEGGMPHAAGFGAPGPGAHPPGPHPGAPAPYPAAGGPMPAAPGDRRGELQQGGTRTVYEFTGAAAARDTASKGTFIGATLDLSHHKEERESNLRSGASTWIFLAVAVLCAGGVSAYFLFFHDGAAAKAAEDAAAVAEAEAEDDAKADEAKAEDDAKADPTGEDPKAEDAKAEDAKAEDAKAEDPKAEDPKAEDPKAEDPKAEDPKAEDPKAEDPKPVEPTPVEPKPKSTTPKKKSTTTKKPTTTKPSEPSGGGKTLSPKKPPRDPLKGLPKPP